MTEDRLKPCPFCGCSEIAHSSDGKSYLYFCCAICGAHTHPTELNPEDEKAWVAASEAWNTRYVENTNDTN